MLCQKMNTQLSLVELEENHVLFLRRRRLVETGDLVVAPGKIVVRCANCGEQIFRYKSQILKRVFCKICRRPDPIKEFWKKVDKTSSPNGCWLWTGKTDDGYGSVNMMGFRRAHRLAYFLLRGPIDPEKFLLHRCPGRHNRLCVNPWHMFVGTKQDNSLDMAEQGTTYAARGEKNYNAILTDEAVRIIRSEYEPGNGAKTRELAERFGINQNGIYDVLHRAWRHVK